MKENSAPDNAKDRERTSLVTVDDTKEAGKTEGTMAMVCASGKMVDVTKGNGSTEWPMAKELKPLLTVLSGMMVSGLKMNLACNMS